MDILDSITNIVVLGAAIMGTKKVAEYTTEKRIQDASRDKEIERLKLEIERLKLLADANGK